MMMRKRLVRRMTRPPMGCQTTPVVICSSGRGCGRIGVPHAGAVAHSTAVATAPAITIASAVAIAPTGSAPSASSSSTTVGPH